MMNSFVPEDFKLPEAMLGQFVPKTPRIRKQLGLDKAWQAIFDKLYFDTSGFQGWMPITESTLLTVRPDRLCFGTDYGFEILEAQDIKSFIDDIKKLNLPEIAKRNILGESARTLFKLNK
jgi:predicted TIM-barrel fold metal-dependent hydrolase